MADLEVLKGVLNFGSFGLIVWLFFHTYTRLIPGLQDRLDKILVRFETSLERQHAECNDMLARQQQRFEEMLEHQRASARQESALFREMHERTHARLADAISKEPQ